MPRPRKDGKFLNVYMKSEIFDMFERYCEAVGQSKTTAVERIIVKHITTYFESLEKSNTDDEKRITNDIIFK